MTAEQLVNDFIAAVVANDLDTAASMCTDDVVYDNVPMMAVTGPDKLKEVLSGFLGMASEIDWVVHRQVASDTTVMNERTDRFEIGGQWLELPVMGVFEVTGGKVSLWRDYFDLGAFNDQMAKVTGG